MTARRICDILGTTGEFDSLAEVSRRIAQLQRIFLEAVPRELAGSSRVGWARGGVLTVIADNGATATKLRQLATRVLISMRRHGHEFNSMRIEVQVDQAASSSTYRPNKNLSIKALSAIERAISDVSDSPLKAALRRLSTRR